MKKQINKIPKTWNLEQPDPLQNQVKVGNLKGLWDEYEAEEGFGRTKMGKMKKGIVEKLKNDEGVEEGKHGSRAKKRSWEKRGSVFWKMKQWNN